MSETLRLITYNIRKGKGANGRMQTALTGVGQALGDHEVDVLLCQEVFHCGVTGASQSAHIAHVLGLDSYYGANKFRRVGHHGNSTFTRHAVTHARNHDISTNRVERRGALHVRLDVAGRAVHVVNVHLGLNERQRMTQIRRVARIIDESCASDEAVVLAGDFNDWTRNLDGIIVRELGFHNVFQDVEDARVWTWHARRPVFSLDRIYARNIEARHVRRLDGAPWSTLSDHLPLLADLHLG